MPSLFVVGFRHRLGAGRACGLHAHDEWELVYHPSGSGRTTAGASEAGFVPGDAVLYPPRTSHDQEMDAAGEDWCVHLRGFAGPGPSPQALWHAGIGDDAATVAELAWLTSGLPRAGDRLAELRLEAVVQAIMPRLQASTLVRQADPIQALAERALRLADERGHALAGVQALAKALGVSGDWLRHACSRAGFPSPLAMLTRARLARARAMLLHTVQPVAEIARQCGYRNAGYLTVVFHRELGCTPTQLRAGRPGRRSR